MLKPGHTWAPLTIQNLNPHGVAGLQTMTNRDVVRSLLMTLRRPQYPAWEVAAVPSGKWQECYSEQFCICRIHGGRASYSKCQPGTLPLETLILGYRFEKWCVRCPPYKFWHPGEDVEFLCPVRCRFALIVWPEWDSLSAELLFLRSLSAQSSVAAQSVWTACTHLQW